MAGQRSSADERYGRQAGGTGVFCIFRGRYSALARSSKLDRSDRLGRLSALLTPAADTAVFDSGNSCRYHPFYRRARLVLPAAERGGGRSTGADHAEPPARRYSVPQADGVAMWWSRPAVWWCRKNVRHNKKCGRKNRYGRKRQAAPSALLKLSSGSPQTTLKIPQIIPDHPQPSRSPSNLPCPPCRDGRANCRADKKGGPRPAGASGSIFAGPFKERLHFPPPTRRWWKTRRQKAHPSPQAVCAFKRMDMFYGVFTNVT